jgi:hypothetical protein
MIATVALAVICGLLSSIPSASAATGVRPVFKIIPAFGKDLPLSGSQTSSSTTSSSTTSSAPLAAWVCTAYAGDPTLFATTFQGEGFQSCTGSGWSPQKIRVTLKKYMGLSFWNNLVTVDSGYTTNFSVDLFAYFNCQGQGTQTYRVITDGYAAGGAYYAAVQSAGYLWVGTC